MLGFCHLGSWCLCQAWFQTELFPHTAWGLPMEMNSWRCWFPCSKSTHNLHIWSSVNQALESASLLAQQRFAPELCAFHTCTASFGWTRAGRKAKFSAWYSSSHLVDLLFTFFLFSGGLFSALGNVLALGRIFVFLVSLTVVFPWSGASASRCLWTFPYVWQLRNFHQSHHPHTPPPLQCSPPPPHRHCGLHSTPPQFAFRILLLDLQRDLHHCSSMFCRSCAFVSPMLVTAIHSIDLWWEGGKGGIFVPSNSLWGPECFAHSSSLRTLHWRLWRTWGV